MTATGTDASLRSGLEAATSGIAIWGPDRRLIYANRSFLGALGSAAGSLTPGASYDSFLKIIADGGEWILPSTQENWIAEKTRSLGTEQYYEQALADGRTLAVVEKPTNEGGVTFTVTDISGVKRSELILLRAKERAEETDQAKSRFLRAANHDLRQPLSTLKILIYSCLREDRGSSRKDILHAMDIAVAIMEELLGALLQIGQLDAGRIIPRITTFQLSQIFERLEIQFRHLTEEKKLSLNFVGGGYTVTSDKALLERILTNFLANAVKYTSFGGILMGCRRVGSALRIEVCDTGRGIGLEHMTKIFDEFYRVPEAHRDKTSIGLGLNIVKRLAALLDHRISARSVPGKGSIFSIEVPLGNIWHSNVGEPEISEVIGGEFVGVEVLLVEDDDVLRNSMKDMLEHWGIKVTAADSKKGVLGWLSTTANQPKLVISDYSLQEDNGVDVIRSVRQHFKADVPGFIITADTEPKVLQDIRSSGLHVLIKPVSPARLRVLMHSLLFEKNSAPQQS